MNTFETEDSIKNSEDFNKLKGELVAIRVIACRESKGEFDHIDIKSFSDENEKIEGNDEIKIKFRKNSIIYQLKYVRKLLDKVTAGEKLVGVKLSFKDSSIRFTYNDSSYVAFEIESDEVLNVDLNNDGIKFKCTLKKIK